MYPAFDPTIHRYGLTTTDATAGSVTVTASTSDPSGSIWVDGQPAASSNRSQTGVIGFTTVSELRSGNEISVFIKDSAGTAVYSLVYLPVAFPTMTVTQAPGVAKGDVLLTLSDLTGTTPSYETAVDDEGVPVYVKSDVTAPLDFKLQPNGDYSVFRNFATTSVFNGEVVELNSQFQPIRSYQTVSPLDNTDPHDSILLPNGDAWLIASEHNAVTGNTDEDIQEQDSTGHILFQWDTDGNIDPTLDGLSGTADYAHLNSIALAANGDIVASMRNTSQVVEIATSAHDGFTPGQIVWSLGGRRPSLSIVDPPDDPFNPDTGPCGQHDATVLPNGNILMFDDGSESSGPLCVPPTNPTTGAAVAREQTRVAEYSIDTAAKTATLVWSYEDPGRDSSFLGSAQRLPNGNTLVGWGGNHDAVATEVNALGQPVWELKDGGNLISYRAQRVVVPDAIKPVVKVTAPTPGATYAFGQKVASGFSCTDQGGSSLHSCNGPVAEGSRIDTSTPGTHTFTVVAKDGAGNTTTVTRTYHVGQAPARYQPDTLIKRSAGTAFIGGNIYGSTARQRVSESIAHSGKSAVSDIRVQNDGNRTDRFTVKGTAGTRKFTVAYFAGAKNVTKQVLKGTYTTPSLAPAAEVRLRVTVTRTGKASHGDVRTVTLTAASVHSRAKHDSVAAVVRAGG